jgi:hypothetical protein
MGSAWRVVGGLAVLAIATGACSRGSDAPAARARTCAPRVVTTDAQLARNSGQSDEMAGMHPPDIALSSREQHDLDAQLAAARRVAARYPTLADARADGYVYTSDEQPGVGAHWTNWGLVRHCGFDLEHPSQLLYRGRGAQARLIALSYFVYQRGGPPAGFAGPNDMWHQHLGLCIANGANIGLVQRDGFDVGECHERKGVVLDGRDLWMLHVWVVPGDENPWGVFASENPKLA